MILFSQQLLLLHLLLVFYLFQILRVQLFYLGYFLIICLSFQFCVDDLSHWDLIYFV